MLLAFGTSAIVLLALLSVLALPRLRAFSATLRVHLERARRRSRLAFPDGYDPGRELRAEQRARALLRSCVNAEEWNMYRELGFLRVTGVLGQRPCAYLIYPHLPIVAYEPATGVVLGEHCVEFPDHTRPYGSSRLPDSDDILAKWIALVSDERSLIERSNMHLPGRQIGIAQVHSDLARLARWTRAQSDTPRAATEDEHVGALHSPSRRLARTSHERPPLRVGSLPAR